MLRFRAVVEYSGFGFCGMQKQDGVPTVEGALELALERFFDQKVGINFAGRTDTGVHALGQVIDFVCPKERTCDQVLNGVNFFLRGYDVCVLNVDIVDDDFNSRFDAVMRHYVYKIINREVGLTICKNTHGLVFEDIDVEAAGGAGASLLGLHDFTFFRNTKCDKNPVRTLSGFRIQEFDGDFGKEVHLHFSAKSFLHNMVRRMVGAIVNVGTGKLSADEFALLVCADPSAAGLMHKVPAMPPQGLYFVGVDY